MKYFGAEKYIQKKISKLTKYIIKLLRFSINQYIYIIQLFLHSLSSFAITSDKNTKGVF